MDETNFILRFCISLIQVHYFRLLYFVIRNIERPAIYALVILEKKIKEIN